MSFFEDYADSWVPNESEDSWYERRNYQIRDPRYEPYTDPPAVLEHDQRELENLKKETSINNLKNWINDNFGKVRGYDYLKEELASIITSKDPEMKLESRLNPAILISHVRRIINELEDRFGMFNVSYRGGVLDGSMLGAQIDHHRKKINLILGVYNDKIERLENENKFLIVEVSSVKDQLMIAEETIRTLRGERYHEDVPGEESFLDEMKVQLNTSRQKQSSLLEEKERDQRLVERLQEDLRQQQKELLELHEQHMKEYADIAKDFELDDGIKQFVLQRIESLEASPEECKRAVNEWMKVLQETLEEKKEDIESIKERAMVMDDQLADFQAQIAELQDDLEECNNHHAEKEQEVEQRRQEVEQMTYELDNLDQNEAEIKTEIENVRKEIERLEQLCVRYYKNRDLKNEEVNELGITGSSYESRSSGSSRSPDYSDRNMSGHQHSMRSPEMADITGSSYESRSSGSSRSPEYSDRNTSGHQYSMRSPEMARGADSPNEFSTTQYPRPFNESSPMVLDSSSSRRTPDRSMELPSPLNTNLPQSPHSPGSRGTPRTVSPGTQTMPMPQNIQHPEINRVNPATQNITEVQNRFDIGRGFNMQTIHSGLPSSYHQVTRMESTQPREGTSPLIESPMNLKHIADFSPDRYVTPFISHTRYGYTDPKAKVLNIPPGDDLDIGTSLRKTLLLTSPRREQPLVVNIDVQPKPLSENEMGEHFVCDISLDVQDARRSQLSPVVTYGVPPEVTPTTTRRHGLFTPRGIFKKKHFNRRKVVGPNYVSPDQPWSPHYLPFDSRSPISGLVPSPHVSDRSISWEKNCTYDTYYSPTDLNTTFDASAGPAMNRTFDASAGPAMNRTFDASAGPAMNRTFDATAPSSMNRTFEASPSPVIKGPSYRSRTPMSDRTSDSSPSPVIKGQFRRQFSRSPSPVLDRTFDRSQSPALDRSPSPAIRRPFTRSPSSEQDSSFDRSYSPVIQRSFARSPSSGQDSSFDRSYSPVIQRSFARSPSSGQDSSFDRSYSPRNDRSFDRGSSPISNRKFDRSPSFGQDSAFDRSYSPRNDRTSSPISNRTFDRSPSPAGNKTFDRSPSPVNRTFERSPSSKHDSSSTSGASLGHNVTFDRNKSPGLDGTFDRSPRSFEEEFGRNASPRLNSTFNERASPQLERTLDRSKSPQMHGTFNRTSSPRSGGTFDRSLSPTMNRTSDSNSSSRHDSYSSHGNDQTFDSHFPQLDRQFERSMPPRTDVSFNQSASPRHEQSISPQPNRTFDKTESPQLNETFDGETSTSSNRTSEGPSSPQTTGVSGTSERGSPQHGNPKITAKQNF